MATTTKKSTTRSSTTKKAAVKAAPAKKAAVKTAPVKKATPAKKATAPAPKKTATAKPAPVKKAIPKSATKKSSSKRINHQARWHMISEAAYFKAEKRGFLGGDPAADWSEAETQIDAYLKGAGIVVKD